MCGICGAFGNGGAAVGRELIEKMSTAIRHRGPDGEGQYVSGAIGLGHRRLSIIDIASGAQPITNEDDSLHIVFNGEIYNFIELREELEKQGHRFKTRSDTEVIVHAYEEWGLDCVKHFNGMFAFAIWDENRQRLVLARDHLGIKPLYYTSAGKHFLFASEIKALLVHPDCPREVDLEALAQLFTLRYVPSPNTLFRGIKKLPPGHWMTISNGDVRVQRYWDWTPQIRQHYHERDLIETYRELVEDAVRLQMRSDVPVGLFLSSGIDSGALLALMSQHSTMPVHTFTIGFEDGERSNEIQGARELATRFGATHTEMVIGPRDYVNYYERYLWDLEEPVGNESAAAFYFVSRIASEKVKVALTGQGADEPWAGYHRHMGARLSQIYGRLPRALTDHIVRPAVMQFAKDEKWRRGVISLSEPEPLARLIKIYSFYSTEMKSQLFQPWVLDHVSADGSEARQALSRLYTDVAHFDDPVTQMTYIDTRANLPDDLLMVGDKTSMANSLEARVPFLDYRLVEFVESLPSQLKLRGLQGKYLHKKALEKWLPRKVVYQKKKGFANPVNQWLRTHMREFVNSCLLTDRSAVNRYFRRDYIQQLLTEHEAGQQDRLRHIYLLVSFELWHQQFIPS
jgi:asparagine synthase (glutamine-hydrolysing)